MPRNRNGTYKWQPATTIATTISSFFGSSTSTQSTAGSLFSQPTSTSSCGGLFNFGDPKSTFTTASGTTDGGLFGECVSTLGTQTTTANTGSGLFGGTDAAGILATGTAVMKYNPTASSGEDSVKRGDSMVNIHTKLCCITAMHVYENKSVTELRLEDYRANRKQVTNKFGGAASSTTTGFGASTGGIFGFGGETPASTSTTSIFGPVTNNFGGASTFGTSTTMSSAFPSSFGTTTTGTTSAVSSGVFGQQPFFGSSFAAPKNPLFGQPATVTTSLFGLNTKTTGTTDFGVTTIRKETNYEEPIVDALGSRPYQLTLSPISPEYFEDGDLPRYFDSFEIVARANGWSETVSCTRFPLFLKGRAANLYTKMNASSSLSWPTLRNSFTAIFYSPEERMIWLQRFNARLAQPHEPLEVLAEDLKRHLSFAFPDLSNEQLDLLLKLQFMKSVPSHFMRKLETHQHSMSFDHFVNKVVLENYRLQVTKSTL